MYRGLASSEKSNLPVAQTAANEVICLPIYPDLGLDDVSKIVSIILDAAI